MQTITLQLARCPRCPRAAGGVTRARSSGFTLLEVTVALVIVAMLAASLWASLVVAFKARDAAVRQLQGVRQTRVAMDAITRDLHNALPPTGVLAGAFIATPRENGENVDSVTFFATTAQASTTATATVARPDVVEVTLTVLPESMVLTAEVDQPLEENPQLGPRFAPVETGQDDMVLVRRVNDRLLAAVAAQPPYEILARRVEAFTLSYYDGAQWTEEWDSTTMDNQLPQAVEITLQIALDQDDAQPTNASAITTGMTSTSASARTYTMKRIVRPTCHGWAPVDASQAQSNTSDSDGGFGGGGGQGGGSR